MDLTEESTSSPSTAAATLRVVVITAIAVLACLAAVLLILALMTASAYVMESRRVLGVPFDVQGTPWPLAAGGFLVVFGVFAVLGLALFRLQRILGTLAHGDPFIVANARDARLLWIVFGGFELTRYVVAVAASANYAVNSAELGAPFSVALFGALIEQFRPMVWLSVLVIFVLAEVFREGARMRAEQKLTI